MTQWTKVPPGASGSSTISAYEAVLAGAPDQARGGEWFAPSQVNFAGMASLFLKAGLVRTSAALCGAPVSELARAAVPARAVSLAAPAIESELPARRALSEREHAATRPNQAK